MTTDQMRDAIHAEPFKPFTIYMADGRSYYIPHREFIYQTPGGRITVVASGDDCVSIIDLLLVNELKFGLQTSGKKPRKNGNGHS